MQALATELPYGLVLVARHWSCCLLSDGARSLYPPLAPMDHSGAGSIVPAGRLAARASMCEKATCARTLEFSIVHGRRSAMGTFHVAFRGRPAGPSAGSGADVTPVLDRALQMQRRGSGAGVGRGVGPPVRCHRGEPCRNRRSVSAIAARSAPPGRRLPWAARALSMASAVGGRVRGLRGLGRGRACLAAVACLRHVAFLSRIRSAAAVRFQRGKTEERRAAADAIPPAKASRRSLFQSRLRARLA
jgi:hypothetical protein